MMHPTQLRPLVLAVLAAMVPQPIHAALDEVQVRMLQPYALPLRWDNIERAPEWVNGARPSRRHDQGLHTVILAPGESVTLRIARNERVRVWRAAGELAAGDLEMEFSLGSGLYQRLPAALSADRHGMLSRMRANSPYLVRLTRPREAATALEVALFASRHEPLGELASYRAVIDLPGDEVQMRRGDQAAAQAFWVFKPRQPVEVRVKGPARYALENRLAYPAGESALVQTYRVHAQVDGIPLATLGFETSAETAYPVYVNRQQRVMGRAEVGYLEIPPGEHLLRLDSTVPLHARLLLQEQPDYLLPHLNEPLKTAVQAREDKVPFRLALSEQLSAMPQPIEMPQPIAPFRPAQSASLNGPLQLRLSPWLIQPAELARASQEPALTPSEHEAAALRLVRDNARREGGLLGATLMQESALRHEDYPAVQAVANDLFGFHTFYRDLMPEEKLSKAQQYFARFIPRDLHALGDQGRGITEGEQHLQALLDRIPGAYFSAVPLDTGNSPLEVKAAGGHFKLTLPTDVLFYTDKWALKPRYLSLLEEAAALIRSRRPQRVLVIGHTDSRASEPYNQRLSKRRAQAVAGFLSRHGLSPSLIHVLGKGESKPRASNNTSAGRQMNRRVEILLEGSQPASRPAAIKPGYHRYLLPGRLTPSLLRVIVDAPVAAEEEFFLQFDAAEPMRMRTGPAAELAPTEYAPAQGDAALEMLAKQFGWTHAATLDGAFAARRAPARLIRAGIMEIPLPNTVREVRVWRGEKGAEDIHLALQYRAAKPFSLSETEYLEMAARSGETPQVQAVFARTLARAVAAESEYPAQELGNHWLPVIRALRSEYKVFTAPVVALELNAGQPAMNPVEQSRLQSAARAAERRGQWLLALESWGELARRAPRPQQEEARLAQAEVLFRLGEGYLAEQQLRGLALHASESSMRTRARARLAVFYQASGDLDGLQSLWTALTVLQPNSQHLRHLVETLADNDKHDMALALGLLLPVADQPRAHLLRAAYQLGWWTVYQRLVASDSPEKVAYWQGLAAMSQGRSGTARELFSAGGSPGQEWLAALDSGSALVERIAARQGRWEDADVDAWQRWHAAHPGPYTWREEAHLVFDYAGSETLYSIDRDAYSMAFRASADKPLRLRVMGPVRLRFEARPLHQSSASLPVDGWLRIKEKNGMRVLPISNNVPASGLQLAGRDDLKPGRKVTGDFDFGPGLQEVELDAGTLPVLLRVLARRPERVIPLVAPLHADSVAIGRPAATKEDRMDAAACAWKDCAVLVPPQGGVGAVSRDLRLGRLYEQGSHPGSLPKGTLTALPPAGEALPGMGWPEASKLASGDVEGALALHPGKDEVDAVRRMMLLLWWSEQGVAVRARERALVEGEALGAQYPANPMLQSMLSRLSRDALWQLVPGIQDSAGQRYLEVSGWQPESPALRARRALMQPFGPEDQMVSGNGRLVFALRNLRATQVDLQLNREEVAHLVPLPLKVFYQLNDQSPIQVLLSGANSQRTLRLKVPAGDHALRIGIKGALANQFLRARLVERGPSVPLTQVERPYHVATQREPLRVAVAGPAWLRIDELRDGRVESRYQWVRADYEELRLTPAGKRQEALFRVYQRSLVPGATPILPRPTEVESEPVPPAYARLEASVAPLKVAFQDGFHLGDQEDGTWSYSAQLARRRDSQGVGSSLSEQFLQLGASYRYYDEDRRTYFRTDLLGRLRESGGPTLGLLKSIEHRPGWTTLNFTLDGGVYLQRPDGGLPIGSSEWSAFLKASVAQKRDIDPKTYHVPRLSLFVRHFSLGASGSYDAGKIDQDVFTPYKSGHRHGLEVGDTLYHRPWLDTLWSASASAVSNENFGIRPDQLAFKLGWQQLLGRLQLDARYQAKHYFADDQRLNASKQHTWLLDASWNQWSAQQNRSEIGIQLRHDSDTRAVTGMLYFTWHDSNGRRYRDFRPGEVDFRDLRTRDIPPTPNNAVKEAKDE